MLAPVDISKIRIETPRLILRPWQESDLEDLYAYARVDGVGQMAGWLPHRSMEESRKILEMFLSGNKTLALEYKETGRVIGSIGLEDIDFDLTSGKEGREVGYVLSKDFWGKGLMPEAVKAVIDYCFSMLNYDWLTCGYFAWNDQSRRVVEKCGFQYVRNEQRQTQSDTEETMRLYVLYHPDRR